MTEGASQGLFVVVAIVIFGIFVLIASILFRKILSKALVEFFQNAINKASGEVNNALDYSIDSGV